MKRYEQGLAILVAFVFAAVAGCDESVHLCSRLCDKLYIAEEEFADDYCGGFEDSRTKVKGACKKSCREEYDDLSKSDEDDVSECLNCILDELDKNPDVDDFEDAIYDCDDECADQDVADFWEDFYDEWFDNVEYDEVCVTPAV